MQNQEPSAGDGSPPQVPTPLTGPNLSPAGTPPLVVAPRNPALHLIVSFFLPGVGSMMNGDVGKGVAILVGYVVCWVLVWLLIPLFVAVGLWIYGMVDAYQGAKRWNLAHGIVS